ncbi:MAG TPA: hypothetical protein EYG51_16710 [Pseudomonadales bacterium]|nr:hypothetical protein [Pseudomonadales bacterium]
MSISVKQKELRRFVHRILFEQIGGSRAVAAGDKTTMGPTSTDLYGVIVGPDDASTLGQEVPIEPSEMMATQLADERPPVEDEGYLPANGQELARAADVLAQLVPQTQIEHFYEDLKRLVDAHIEQSRNAGVERPIGMEEKMPVEQDEAIEDVTGPMQQGESKLRKKIKNILTETDDDWWDTVEGPSTEDISAMEAGQERGTYRADVDIEPGPSGSGIKDSSTLEILAPLMGKSGASGARQELERIMQRMAFVGQHVDDQQMDALKSYATLEYVDVLMGGGFIDEAEAADLRANLNLVRELPSWRVFLAQGFILPAFRAVKRKGQKAAESFIDTLNVPRRSRTSIMNQATGAAKLDAKKLAAKVIQDAMADGRSEAEAVALSKSVRRAFKKIKQASEPTGDLVRIAMDRWDSLSGTRKQQTLAAALGETVEFEEIESTLAGS